MLANLSESGNGQDSGSSVPCKLGDQGPTVQDDIGNAVWGIATFFFFFLHLWHMNVPGLGIKPSPQQ